MTRKPAMHAPLHQLANLAAIALALAGGVSEFIVLQAWRLRERFGSVSGRRG